MVNKVKTGWPAVAFILIALWGCAGTGNQSSAPSFPINEHTQIYEVFGMDCPGCHGGLEKLVNKIPGVVDSHANWEKQRLWVQTDPETSVDPKAVIQAVREANFTIGERIQ